MLVLSRHAHEGIQIGESIRVVVVAIRGDQVRLGIIAPDDVPIARDELGPIQPRAKGQTTDGEQK